MSHITHVLDTARQAAAGIPVLLERLEAEEPGERCGMERPTTTPGQRRLEFDGAVLIPACFDCI